MNTNIWSNHPVVAIWAGSLTLLCFAGGLLLKRKWTAAVAVAVAGPIVLLPMAFAGGLGALALGEILSLGAAGSGSWSWAHAVADTVMLFTPFAMLTLYVRYEHAFNRSDRASSRRNAARARKRNFDLGNRREVIIEHRKNAAPNFVFPRRNSRHQERAGKRVAKLPKLPRRLARHPRSPGRPVPFPHPRG